MLQSVIVEGDRRGWEKRDDRARAIQRLAAPRENSISWGRSRGKDSGVQTSLWERKLRYVFNLDGELWICLEGGGDNRMRSNRETMLSKTLCRLLLIFFSTPLISHVSFEKIFLSSSCLRPTFETLLWHLCCALCYTLNPANGLSFPGMEGDGYCSTLDFSLLRSLFYLFRVSDWTSWDFGCALSFLNFERKLSFDKMKGGVWIEIVGSFLFLFRFSLLQGFEKWEGINSWLTCKEEIKY